MEQSKRCPGCGEVKPFSEFYANRAKPDGRSGYCKVCQRKANDRWAERNQESLAAARRRHRKLNYERLRTQERAWAGNNKDKTAAYAKRHYQKNRELVLQRSRERRRRNPDQVRETYRRWAARNWDQILERSRLHNARRRALQRDTAATRISKDDLTAKILYWGSTCWVCGESWEQIDHVKPLAKGGAHVLANLRPICKPCNQKKKARWPISTARRPRSK